jgi:hypothetical protein
MTLPSDWSIPSVNKIQRTQPTIQDSYDRVQQSLIRMYQLISDAVNGRITTNNDASLPFVPTIIGTLADGIGTYTHQIGWAYSQGLMRDIWFDVAWTAHTGHPPGDTLAMKLPYLVAMSKQMPFIGVCQLSSITFAGTYVIINAIPDTRRLEFWDITSGAATTQIPLDTVGRAIGHIRYIGQSVERT